MNVFSIQCAINQGQKYKVVPFTFDSTTTILDADLIFWNIEKSEPELPSGNHNSITSNRWNEILDKRRKEFQEYLQLGRSLIIFSPSFNDRQIHDKLSGSFHNLNFISTLPIEKQQITNKSGSSIEPVRIESVQNYFNLVGHLFHYKYEFSSPTGIPLMMIKDTQYVVSQYFKANNGIIIFLPNLQNIDEPFINFTISFLESLKKLQIKNNIELPLWAKTTEIVGERKEKELLNLLQIQKEDIEVKIEAQREVLRDLNNFKILFTGSGIELEDVVRLVFSEIGFEIEEPEKGRDDLIIHHGDFVAVIEAKGVDGSSAEKHAAQLQKWVSAYHEKHEREPKGILIANTYRKIPIYERTQEDFPHQMLKYVERMGHCLMTGAQLLYLLIDFRNGKLSIEDICTLLSERAGILEYGNKADYFENLPNQQ